MTFHQGILLADSSIECIATAHQNAAASFVRPNEGGISYFDAGVVDQRLALDFIVNGVVSITIPKNLNQLTYFCSSLVFLFKYSIGTLCHGIKLSRRNMEKEKILL
jgi:hypothetical protein